MLAFALINKIRTTAPMTKTAPTIIAIFPPLDNGIGTGSSTLGLMATARPRFGVGRSASTGLVLRSRAEFSVADGT